MRLVIGGAHQGKLAYILAETGLTAADIATDFAQAANRPVFSGLHCAVAELLARGDDPAAAAEALLARNPDLIILCDEVGCGVVPVDRAQRSWREAVGRLCCMLAARADRVERVYCGLATLLKGE